MNKKLIKIIHDIGVCNETIGNYLNLVRKYEDKFILLKIKQQHKRIKKLYKKYMEIINNAT